MNQSATQPIAVTDGDFAQQVLQSDRPVLVDFWAEWCAPCRMLGPVLESLSAEYDGQVTIAKLDVDANQQVAMQYGIRSIPTIMAFRDGVQVFSQPGALPADSLEELIRQVEALDMDEIHRQIAEHAADHDHEHGPDCDH